MFGELFLLLIVGYGMFRAGAKYQTFTAMGKAARTRLEKWTS